MLIGGYEDSLKRLGVVSWQAAGAGAAPSYHFDMLQDAERNAAYSRGIESVVEEDDLVVDIGTGSGILALMAAKAGAQHVFAIEGDPSLERAARKVVAANGRADAVTVVGRHSTQLKVGFGADVPTGADVIVTEIFDSWLLGEGMVPVMHDAVQRGLLAPHGRVVPAGAQIWAVLIESEYLASHQQLPAHALDGLAGVIASLADTKETARRWSPPEPLQVHANMLEARGLGRRLSAPFAAQSFDFARPRLYENRTVEVQVTSTGRVDGVMLWWTADMDGASGRGRAGPHGIPVSLIPDEGKIEGAGVFLSTRPSSTLEVVSSSAVAGEATAAYPPPEREHWRQAACMLPEPALVDEGQTLALHCAHTGTTDGACAPRFALAYPSEYVEGGAGGEPALEEKASRSPTSFPALRRCHLVQLANSTRESRFFEAAARVVASIGAVGAVVLAVGDGPLLPLAVGRAVVAAGLAGHKAVGGDGDRCMQVVCLQSSIEAADLTQKVVAAAGLENVVTVTAIVAKGDTFHGCARDALLQAAGTALQGRRAAAVVGEPGYHALAVAGAGGTWLLDEVVRFQSEVLALRDAQLLSEDCVILPRRATLWCRPLDCAELWRRRNGRLSLAQGIDLQEFNAFRPHASCAGESKTKEEWGQAPAVVDLLPWHGSIRWLAPSSHLLDFDLTHRCAGETADRPTPPEACVQVGVDGQGTWHGVALWMSLSLCPEASGDDTGAEISVDASGEAAAGYSQALHMLAQPQMLKRGDSIRGRLRWVPREMQAREIEGAEGVRPAVAASVAFDTA